MRRRARIRWIVVSLWRAGQRWVSHECVDLSAAFAYFTLQSIFPLLLIALSVFANVIGKADSLDYLFSSLSPVLPPSALDLVETTLRGLVDQGFGAGLFGVVVLLVTASNAFLTLQRGADRLWEEWMPSPTQSQSFSFQAIQFIRSRLEAFMIVLLLASLLLVEQVVVGFRQLPDELLATLQQFAPELSLVLRTGPVTRLGQILVPTLFLSLLALLLQRVLPSRRVPLRPLIPGSLLIGFSLTILNSVLSLSIISLGNRYQAYGVIGGVLVLTLWVWLVGLILYFGQCWSVELSLRLRQPAQGQPNLTSA
ncbi:YihY/virulence factor BrkB family protein [Parasynechococcus marenigrum]|uniref:Similar to serum resistance locus BrkB n=1 Tax=Parasynechococcus marenigrum (strain WH8102) TaxID=84588 RepID=Q7U486_PARMW|nr:YihY/virulence factor BrkB family protein [Parasynechococcus marenigrum]QNJ17976.1 virulence factor BrkB family protein [Synechococcus sp. A18-40]CAE08700.1 similar to serum resistance locus BrkB [Parasynechococcus marenigrum WH 8102]